jgi:hypothetical protein
MVASMTDKAVTIACNGVGGRAGFEIIAFGAGPLMRDVIQQKAFYE